MCCALVSELVPVSHELTHSQLVLLLLATAESVNGYRNGVNLSALLSYQQTITQSHEPSAHRHVDLILHCLVIALTVTACR